MIEQIYRARLPELCRVAAAISGSRQAAPDLVQEAFVRAVRRLDSFRSEGPLEGWLWRIVVNVANNGRRVSQPIALPQEKRVPDTSQSPVGEAGRPSLRHSS